VHLHHPEQRFSGIDEREVDEARIALAGEGAELARPDPRRHPLGSLLLEEALPGRALAVALHRERAIPEVRD
jgi:hypothetical protein